MWRRYDLVLSARAGKRSITNAWLAGRMRISNVRAGLGRRAWQRHLLHEAIAVDDQSHAVMQSIGGHGPSGMIGTPLRSCKRDASRSTMFFWFSMRGSASAVSRRGAKMIRGNPAAACRNCRKPWCWPPLIRPSERSADQWCDEASPKTLPQNIVAGLGEAGAVL